MIQSSNLNLEHFVIDSDENHVVRIVINDQKEGMLYCPNCKNIFVQDISCLGDVKNFYRIKCNCICGHTFHAIFDRRESLRKSVSLIGSCLYVDDFGLTNKQLINVLDVSMTGLNFAVRNLPEFKVGDTLIVDFRLDDREQSQIQEKATVIRICSKTVGIKFENKVVIRKLIMYLLSE